MGKKTDRLTPEQKKENREKATFKRKIISVFKNTRFEYLNTEGIHKKFGHKIGELDYVFIYENIILVCEDTTSKKERAIKTHLKNKKLLADQIVANKTELINWLSTKFEDKFSKFDSYSPERYQLFYLYFTKEKLSLSEEDVELYKPILVVQHSSLNYFYKMTQNIKYSARNEIFRFLDIHTNDIGTASSTGGEDAIETTIIYPSDNTGLRNGVRIVSFMMSAEKLLKNCYVLRKDNWEESIQLYQRLIEKNRIQNIRQYLATNKTTFFNNIIVSLPKGVTFKNKDNELIALETIHGFENCKMYIPNEINSICVIDGQHRIFAHYEGEDNNEKIIEPLRKKLHLLVTGLIFPTKISTLDRRKYESQIFLDINSNAKPVPPDVLLHIETLKNPFSSIGIARQVLVKLNKIAPFHNCFQLSLMVQAKIKIASIIKFALKYLVEPTSNPERESLFKYWNEKNKNKLLGNDDTLLSAYVEYISNTLIVYFLAIKEEFKGEWDDNHSKILSTTSINGFIIAFRRSLKFYGVKDSEFYRDCIRKLSIDFSKDSFPYTSSQYNKFSKQISKECFDLVESEDGEWSIKS
jgi:DGQHR domain-containing protein